jgi:hypothetical protein
MAPNIQSRAKGRTATDSQPGVSRAGWIVGVLALAGAAFGLGWWARSPTPAPAPVSSVELRLDPSKLTLIPDGGLELPPIHRVEVDDLLEPAPAESGVTATPRGATNTRPSGL